MKAHWKVILPSLLLGILLGAGAGTWAQRKAISRLWHKGPDTERTLKRLTRKLELDSAQQDKVRAALEARRVKLSALRDKTAADFLKIRSTMKADVEKALRPDQRQMYEAIMARVEARHKDIFEHQMPPPGRKEVP
ncbi:MAG: hypothetical protein HY077_18225 [Elusimicrobia bacterium]|nr:hypothetical protein [Elusimicrobiota bacterium]